MNKEFIEATLQRATYRRKEGTTTSYYWKSGIRILPNRLGITKDQFANAKRKGRNLQSIAGQIKGNFKQSEKSPLKKFKPYSLHTQIWKIPEYPILLGYGSIGVTNKEGKIDRSSDTEDLILLYSGSPDLKEIDIYYFSKGLRSLYDISPIISKMIIENKKGAI
jgi:hypothetical protein